jgi:hypothetical protein
MNLLFAQLNFLVFEKIKVDKRLGSQNDEEILFI